MYFRYGNYTHPSNTVNLTQIALKRMYSPRNRLHFDRWTLYCEGHFCTTGQANIKSQLREFETAYRKVGGAHDVGLYHDDDTKSAHWLGVNGSINGVRVMAIKYPGREAEYASGRSFALTFQADYLNAEDTINSFDETVQMIGTTGPRWRLKETFSGPPDVSPENEWTVQKIVQQGKCVGVQAPPLIPGPILPINYEHLDMRRVTRQSARQIGRLGKFLYPLQYRYVFSSGIPQNKYPHADYPGH